MSIARKCPNCRTWNEEQTHCISCGTLLDPALIRAEKEERKAQVAAEREPNVLDRWVDAMRHSRWWLVRAVFWAFYSIWFVFFSIISFFLAFIAAGPG